jgi:uncharacterized protein YjbI with pentapeptide repeats
LLGAPAADCEAKEQDMDQKISRLHSRIKEYVPISLSRLVFLILVIIVIIVIVGYITKSELVGVAGRTFFEWLDILIFPAVLALGVYWLEGRQEERALEIEGQRAREREQDAALQGYFDQMEQLLLDRQLRDSEESEEVRALARSRTLATLENLNATRKRHLLQSLYEARLIDKEGRVVPLDGANLRDANLRYITLERAALDGAILERADLRDAKLSGINLGGAYLSGADLTGADLRDSELVYAHLQRKEDLNLGGANLARANLKGANLAGANLSGNNTVSEEQLASCDSVTKAIMPNGLVHE